MRWLLLIALCTAPGTALAHSGFPAIARMLVPERPGMVVDRSVELRWEDSDSETPNGPATIDFFYTSQMPPTFAVGALPLAHTATAVALGIPEPELTNTLTWDTSAVPSGHYWVWSIVREPPQEMGSLVIVSFTPAPITVLHPGDEVGPAIALVTPDTPFRLADASYEIRYRAYDPTGSARVRLEATQSYDGTRLMVIAEDLPASEDGVFRWNTSFLPDDEWTIRATITDCEGRSFHAYAPYFLNVAHVSAYDAGVLDAGFGADASSGDFGVCPEVPDATVPSDAGVAAFDARATDARPASDASEAVPPEEGCGCGTSRRRGGSAGLLLVIAALGLRARRR